jgi:hypothetical protein
MRRMSLSSRLAFGAAVSGLIMGSLPAWAQATTDKTTAAATEAVAACEKAARQTLVEQGAHAAEVTFNATPAVQSSLSNDSQVVLRGAARWRNAGGAHSFNYSCNVDLRTSQATGFVMRDSTPVAAEAVPARAPTEPDMSHVLPAACESSAVEALKQRWPRVSQISFDTATRRLLQESPGRAKLHGHGRALPVPEAPSTYFGFDCEIDPRDGRVLNTRVSG